MDDTLSIVIGGKTISNVVSYTIEHNIYCAAGTFSIDCSPQAGKQIFTGDRIDIKVNGVTVLTGIVERKECSGSKNAISTKISGRDLMGLVVDHCIELFHTIKNKTLLQVAGQYLGEIDFVKSLNVTYMDGADSLDIPQEYVQPHHGQTIFELLSGIAASRGMHFYMRADGNVVFGKPRGYGTYRYSVWRDDKGVSNILAWNMIDDIGQRYSDTTVYGQKQSTSWIAATALNQKATASDPTFPVSFNKPLVIETNTAAETLTQQARMIIEQQRFNGWNLKYVMPGHTQRGYVWQPDTLCSVNDSRLNIRGQYLIYARTLTLSKNNKTTEITLGKMADSAI